MRVISGSARGLKLLSPEGLDTRPTTDRVKESLFNILQPYIPCDAVLDLFSGSGALGIEALSRGCEKAVFVESSVNALAVTEKNIEKARFLSRAKIIKSEALAFLSECHERFDIIFLDPPYDKGLLEPVFEKIFTGKLLSPDGIIAVETKHDGEKIENGNFEIIKYAKYGKSAVSIFRLRS